MNGNASNLAVIILALGTYGSLAFVIVRSTFKKVRRRSDDAAARRLGDG
jgi:hypothetical protein